MLCGEAEMVCYLLLDTCGLPYSGQQQPAEGESSLLALGCSILCYYTYSVHLHQEKMPNKFLKKMVKGMLTLVYNSPFHWWHLELVELPATPGTGHSPKLRAWQVLPAPALLHAHGPAGSATETVKLLMFICTFFPLEIL